MALTSPSEQETRDIIAEDVSLTRTIALQSQTGPQPVFRTPVKIVGASVHAEDVLPHINEDATFPD